MNLSPTHIRRACLCPRLLVREYCTGKTHRIIHGGRVLPGTFFHEQVAKRLFAEVAAGRDDAIASLVESNPDSLESLQSDLWSHLDKTYFNPALGGPEKPANLAADQVLVLAEGLGLLARVLAELIERQRPFFHSSQDLVKSLFLPPEKKMSSRLLSESGVEFTITGIYDALLFDREEKEFVVLEFKCKGDNELIGDVEQVAAYAWLIREASGIPVRASILYLAEAQEVKHLSSSDLSEAFDSSTRLIREIGKWLSAEDSTLAGIPPTTVDGLCQLCPLDSECDKLFGSRDPDLAVQCRRRVSVPLDEETNEGGIFLGRRLEDDGPVIWRIRGGNPRLANAHMLIVGTSGSGKTQVLKATIAALAENGVTPIVFDFNDDYVRDGFVERHGIRVLDPLDGLPLNPLELIPDRVTGKINVMSGVFATVGILKRIYGLGAQQEANLRNAVEACYADCGLLRSTTEMGEKVFPDFDNVEDKIMEIPNHVALLNRLSPIFSLGLFRGGADDTGFVDFIGGSTVIRLAPLPTEEVKLAIAEFVLLKLYNHLVSQPHRISPFLAIVIDEAHKMNNSAAIIKLFREIRKFGVAVILSSQKARDFDSDIHANAASNLFLKNSETADRRYVADQLKGSAKEKDEIINLLAFQNTFEALFRNDHYSPYVRMRVTPYFELYPSQ